MNAGKLRMTWWIGAAVCLGTLIGLSPWLASQAHHAGVNRQVRQEAAMIRRHARDRGLSPALVLSVVKAESGGDPHAVSNKNARGLMQITPITLREVRQRFNLPKGDLFDPDYNLRVGTAYLGYLMKRFDNDPHLALAAYHMGPTSVRRMAQKHSDLSGAQIVEQQVNPTTRAYVRKVLAGM